METENKNALTNLSNHQKEMRAEMTQSVLNALEYFDECGIKVTMKALAEHIGCHVNTLKQPYIREILNERKCAPKKPDIETENRLLKDRISKLEERLAHSLNHNARLQQEKDAAKKRADEYEFKYRRLLGIYQIEVGKKNPHI